MSTRGTIWMSGDDSLHVYLELLHRDPYAVEIEFDLLPGYGSMTITLPKEALVAICEYIRSIREKGA